MFSFWFKLDSALYVRNHKAGQAGFPQSQGKVVIELVTEDEKENEKQHSSHGFRGMLRKLGVGSTSLPSDLNITGEGHFETKKMNIFSQRGL